MDIAVVALRCPQYEHVTDTNLESGMKQKPVVIWSIFIHLFLCCHPKKKWCKTFFKTWCEPLINQIEIHYLLLLKIMKGLTRYLFIFYCATGCNPNKKTKYLGMWSVGSVEWLSPLFLSSWATDSCYVSFISRRAGITPPFTSASLPPGFATAHRAERQEMEQRDATAQHETGTKPTNTHAHTSALIHKITGKLHLFPNLSLQRWRFLLHSQINPRSSNMMECNLEEDVNAWFPTPENVHL